MPSRPPVRAIKCRPMDDDDHGSVCTRTPWPSAGSPAAKTGPPTPTGLSWLKTLLKKGSIAPDTGPPVKSPLVKSEGCYALRPTPGSKPKMFLANGGGLTFPTDPLLSIPDTPDTLSQLETPLDNLSTCSTDDSNPF